MLKFITPFLISFSISVILAAIVIPVSRKIKLFQKKSERDIHGQGVSRMGGLIMILAFVGTIFLNSDLFISPELYGFIFGSIILLLIGFWDDIREILWKIQLFIQVAVATFIFVMGVKIYYITNPLTGGIINLESSWGIVLAALIVIFWVILVINAINWSDGIDGLSGGISFIAAGTIFALSFRPEVNQPPVAIISAALMGSILGFLIFNFHPSKIVAGTAGATFMGFSLAVLAIFSGTKIATSLLVLALPLVDFFWVIGERIMKKKSIFLPDRNHLHHKLMEIGLSQKKIAAGCWIFTLIVAAVSLFTQSTLKLFAVVVVFFLVIFAVAVINWKVYSLRKNKKIRGK